jgi:hypothetical protein
MLDDKTVLVAFERTFDLGGLISLCSMLTAKGKITPEGQKTTNNAEG